MVCHSIGGDAWGYGWGAVAELYHGPYTFRFAWFDTEKSAISNASPTNPIFGDDPTFGQVNLMWELEENHQLWGQPGKVALNVNYIAFNGGTYKDAIAALGTPTPAGACEAAPPNFSTPETSCVRKYRRIHQISGSSLESAGRQVIPSFLQLRTLTSSPQGVFP